MSLRRIYAIILRHEYNFIHSLDRLVDAFYWPTVDIIIFGFTFSALASQGSLTGSFVTVILCGVVLWYVLWRGQYEISVNVLEELWNENFTNLMSTPLTLVEWTVSLLIISVMKLFLTLTFTSVVAFLLYHVMVTTMGLYFFFFVASLLLTGWTFGLFVGGLFMRFGTNIQTLAWAGGYIIMPFSATYYPLSTLPQWGQMIAQFVPSMYVFEGLRAVLQTGTMSPEMMIKSIVLNFIYLSLSALFFFLSFRAAKEKGLNHIK